MEPAPTVFTVHGFLLPTDFQALSFTSPQPQPIGMRLTTNAAMLRHDETKTMNPQNSRQCCRRERFHMQRWNRKKTKCPRQLVTQAFWL
jgi:hypothetical protein